VLHMSNRCATGVPQVVVSGFVPGNSSVVRLGKDDRILCGFIFLELLFVFTPVALLVHSLYIDCQSFHKLVQYSSWSFDFQVGEGTAIEPNFREHEVSANLGVFRLENDSEKQACRCIL
jgi:hypothetical protein